jgi:hypothetical protein
MKTIKLEQFVMTFDTYKPVASEVVKVYAPRETKPFDMTAWHEAQQGQWMPDMQGPVCKELCPATPLGL